MQIVGKRRQPNGFSGTKLSIMQLAQQAAFNRMMQLRAELQREANAMRDLAMEQVKRDDQLMNAWIKLI